MTVAELIEVIVKELPELTSDDEMMWSVIRDMSNSSILNSKVEEYFASDEFFLVRDL